MRKEKILIVDDDSSITISMKIWLDNKGFDVWVAENSDKALKLLKKTDFSVVLVDYRLIETTGIELSENMLKIEPNLKIIMITGFPSYDTAVKAMKKGIFNYISKSESNDEILNSIKKAIEERRKELEKDSNETDSINYVLFCNHSLIKERLKNIKGDKYRFNMVKNYPSFISLKGEKINTSFDLILLCHSCNIEKFKDYYEIISQLKSDYPESKIIVFNANLSDEEKVKLVKTGVKGLFGKDVSSDLLKEGMEKIYEGELWISRKILNMVLEDEGSLSDVKILSVNDDLGITKREKEIINLILKGFKNREIAKRLFITEQTVKTHINNIFKKHEVNNRAQLIVKVLKKK